MDRRVTKSFSALGNLATHYTPFVGRSRRQNGEEDHLTGNIGKVCERCVNLRDCGLVHPLLKPETVYRSSQVVSSHEMQGLRLKAVLDLRVMKKPCKKHASVTINRLRRKEEDLKAMFPSRDQSDSSSSSSSSNSLEDLAEDEGHHNGQLRTLLEAKAGTKICPVCTKEFGKKHHIAVPIYHSDLMPWQMKLRVFHNLPRKTQMSALKEVIKLKNPENLVAAAVVNPDVMGPAILYQLILDHSHSAVAKALRIFCSPTNFPALIHCIHGKDRTGLIVMLLLLICDVPANLVVADYIQSELQLKAGRENGELHELDDFLQTDNVIASKAETMVTTISHLQDQYGSIKEYCETVGLTTEEIEQIRHNLMQSPEDYSSTEEETSEKQDSLVDPDPEFRSGDKTVPEGSEKAISKSAFNAAEKAIEEFTGDQEEAKDKIPDSSEWRLA